MRFVSCCVCALLANPKCESGPGCGEWKAPEVTNPKYKGKRTAPMVDNPNYKVTRGVLYISSLRC